MSMSRLLAIALVFGLASAAWLTLGSTVAHRTHTRQSSLRSAVSGLWGERLIQTEPAFRLTGTNTADQTLVATTNEIDVALVLEHRRKGLMWYPTFECTFDALYGIENPADTETACHFTFEFPAVDATYDDVRFTVDDEEVAHGIDIRKGIRQPLVLAPGGSATVRIRYKTRGLEEWRYQPAGSGRVRGLHLTATTNFEKIDFPDEALSPHRIEATEDGGTRLTWQAQDLLTSQPFGVIMPERLNPGPIATRVTFFAPVCLLFFFALTLLIQIRFGVNIHPMHYLLVAAGFFAFHLAFAYLVDVLNIHLAFWIAAVTSALLVTTYMRGALGPKFPWRMAFAGQIVYLVLFSYSFFAKGATGLTIMVVSILTLALVMRLTVHTDWEKIFQRRPAAIPAPAPPPAPAS